MSNRQLIKKLKNRKILITGTGGFLGKYLASQLKNISKEISLYDNDIRKINKFTERYDIVCHLAGITKIDNKNNARSLFDINVNGTLAVMHYCQKFNARCIFASSSAVYRPAKKRLLLKEDSSLEPNTLYGVTKMLAEDICRYYASSLGISVIALRIFNMYGLGQKMPFLIPYAISQLSGNKGVFLRTPRAVRDFVHVSDIARAFILSCLNYLPGFVALNAGTGLGLSIENIVKKIAAQTGRKLKIRKKSPYNYKSDIVIADIANISKTINWRPSISIDEGLKEILS